MLKKVFVCGSFSLVIAVSVVAGWLASCSKTGGYLAFTLSVFLLPIAFVLGLGYVLVFKQKTKALTILFALGYPLMIVIALEFGGWLSPEHVTQQRGERIVQAIDHYYVENGSYPPKIDELVPDYLDEVPETQIDYIVNTVGWPDIKEWEYSVSIDGESYRLVFWYRDDGTEACGYWSGNDEWANGFGERCYLTVLSFFD